jgi:hypothetical protein
LPSQGYAIDKTSLALGALARNSLKLIEILLVKLIAVEPASPLERNKRTFIAARRSPRANTSLDSRARQHHAKTVSFPRQTVQRKVEFQDVDVQLAEDASNTVFYMVLDELP